MCIAVYCTKVSLSAVWRGAPYELDITHIHAEDKIIIIKKIVL